MSMRNVYIFITEIYKNVNVNVNFIFIIKTNIKTN